MKKLLILVVAFLLYCSTAQAVPLTYTFQGTVTQIVIDDAGAIATAGLSVGSSITHTIMIDFDLEGSRTLNDGTIIPPPFPILRTNYFADYISGDSLTPEAGGLFTAPTDVAENNNAWVSGTIGSVDVLSANDIVSIFNTSVIVPDWIVGTVFESSAWASSAYDTDPYDFSGFSQYRSDDLTLMSITGGSPPDGNGGNGDPIPEPATVALLGIG